ncbi:rRNA-processing protein las1 [Elasticomyces elasticus]|nr:rRNA-processing protein las1 [Elasticomyces elasticus]KAK4992301.1 rRNA-processing protein las1 [Elasticomyces elasticus]
MVEYTVTPWKYRRQLTTARDQLYQLGEWKNDDQRRHAVALVRAWKMRGNLPHAVESTALLVDAVLHQGVTEASPFSVRATYSAAFCRFVTGFCDTRRYKPGTRRDGRTFYDLAAEIDMPSSFVEFRHDATHSDLPELSSCIRHTKMALKWLWDHYWSKLDETPQLTEGSRSLDATNDVETVLRTFRGARRAEVESRKPAVVVEETCSTLVRLCQADIKSLRIVATVLVDRGLLLPSSKTLTGSMEGAFILFDGLLQKLTTHCPQFLPILVHRFLDRLLEPSMRDVKLDTLRRGYYDWVDHLVLSDGWKQARGKSDLRRRVMERTLLQQSYWGAKLSRSILLRAGDEFRSVWAPVYNETLKYHLSES